MNPLPTQQRQVGDLVCSSFTVKRVELDSAIKMPNRASVNLISVWVFVRLQVKYVGDDGEEQNGLQMTGLNLMDKTMAVRGARIAYSIWDVAGKNPKFHEAATRFPGCSGSNARFPTSPDHFFCLVEWMQETSTPSTTSQSRARAPWRSCTCSISRAGARLIS